MLLSLALPTYSSNLQFVKGGAPKQEPPLCLTGHCYHYCKQLLSYSYLQNSKCGKYQTNRDNALSKKNHQTPNKRTCVILPITAPVTCQRGNLSLLTTKLTIVPTNNHKQTCTTPIWIGTITFLNQVCVQNLDEPPFGHSPGLMCYKLYKPK